MDCDISDTFFVRANWGDPNYGLFWDIWVNLKTLRSLRKGVYGAHVSLNCQRDCNRLLPSVAELCRLQDHIRELVLGECFEESPEDFNDLVLQCLMAYNEFYYRLFEAAERHQ